MAYSPVHAAEPFTDFSSVTRATDLSSLNLNWREKDLPERDRTKHVHRLHPYLGKFIPQLVEVFLRKFDPSAVCDPFCGSGTTLVEANALGVASVGCDISAFNCLLSRVKTGRYDLRHLEYELKGILTELTTKIEADAVVRDLVVLDSGSEYVRTWFAPEARRQLLAYRSLISNYEYQDVMKVVLSRSARSARLTTHYDLDSPKEPQTGPYYCRKHRRICRPTTDALQFLRRYTSDTLKRITEFAAVRTQAQVTVIHGDARSAAFPAMDLVITSPPYVGLIDYHEQHRYAYELLGLPQNEEEEIGAAHKGSSRSAQKQYIEAIGQVFANVRKALKSGGFAVIVVHDKNESYKRLAPKVGFAVYETLSRHVNRRTGRRAADFSEQVQIWRKDA